MGYDRWHFYPPPYWYNNQWYYAWPWSWMDGDKDPAYQYSTWEGHLLQRRQVPSDLQIDMNGYYVPETRDGWLNISIYNESSDALEGTFHLVLTESELYYLAPNGLDWHNNVMRAMIPDNFGTPVTLPPGEETIINQDFTIDPAWNADVCELVCFVQDEVMQPDSTVVVWQGAKVSIPAITGTSAVQEPEIAAQPIKLHAPTLGSQPEITFELQQGGTVDLAIYDVDGRHVASLVSGPCAAGQHTRVWSGHQAAPAGVYYCRLTARLGETIHTQTRRILKTR